jgi:hypothetical protein
MQRGVLLVFDRLTNVSFVFTCHTPIVHMLLVKNFASEIDAEVLQLFSSSPCWVGAEPVVCAHKKAYVALLEDLETPLHRLLPAAVTFACLRNNPNV